MLKQYLTIIAVVLPLMLQSQNKPATKYDLYILMGQSNMSGRGKITPEAANEHDDRVLMFTKDKQWVVAKHPLHFDKPSAVGVGPGLTFGINMAKAAKPGVTIGLIPCAVGGTAIARWEPGAYAEKMNVHPYDDAVERIKAAMAYGTVKGLVWHQGEGDSRGDLSKEYLQKLSALIQRIRNLVGNPDLPVVVGELGRYRARYGLVNTKLDKLPAVVKNTAVASSEGLVHRGDTTHFDTSSAQEMGRRMAAKMLILQNK